MEFLERNKDRKDLQVVAVCGRNEGLKERLERGERLVKKRRKIRFWKVKAETVGSPRGELEIHALSFSDRIPELMSASSVLVTKAGPGTIAEAAALSLPTMLTTFLPGQEAGNVDVVLEKGFGDYVRDPALGAASLLGWCNDDVMLGVMSNNAKGVGDAGAAERIA